MAKDKPVTIKIIRGTVCDQVAVEPGQVVETSPATASLLIGMRKAVPMATEAEAPEERDTETAKGLTTRNAGALVKGKKAS